MVLMPTINGIRRILTEFTIHTNYSKTKILVFAKRPKRYHWMLDDKAIEQVRSFKYLDIHFTEIPSWKTYIDSVRHW